MHEGWRRSQFLHAGINLRRPQSANGHGGGRNTNSSLSPRGWRCGAHYRSEWNARSCCSCRMDRVTRGPTPLGAVVDFRVESPLRHRIAYTRWSGGCGHEILGRPACERDPKIAADTGQQARGRRPQARWRCRRVRRRSRVARRRSRIVVGAAGPGNAPPRLARLDRLLA